MTESPTPDPTGLPGEPPDGQDSTSPWPRLSADRVAQAVRELAAGVPDAALRAQLHSLAVAVECLAAQGPHRAGDGDGDGERGLDRLPEELDAAMARGDEPEVVSLARRLAAHHRSLVQAVDWSAVSGG